MSSTTVATRPGERKRARRRAAIGSHSPRRGDASMRRLLVFFVVWFHVVVRAPSHAQGPRVDERPDGRSSETFGAEEGGAGRPALNAGDVRSRRGRGRETRAQRPGSTPVRAMVAAPREPGWPDAVVDMSQRNWWGRACTHLASVCGSSRRGHRIGDNNRASTSGTCRGRLGSSRLSVLAARRSGDEERRLRRRRLVPEHKPSA
jgi:hypothetical protein